LSDVRIVMVYNGEMPPLADRYPMPSTTRIVVGLILAGSLPGGLVALLGLSGGDAPSNALGFGTFLGLFYGAAPALILGLPAIYVLRGVVTPSLKTSVIAGMTVASVPAVFGALTIGPGLLALVPLAAVPLGAIGGATFWLVALRDLRPINDGDTSPPGLSE
jgi:hypothetical protein